MPSLVVCPASLVYNWKREIETYTSELSVAIIAGTVEERSDKISRSLDKDIWVTSYDLLKRDISLYEGIHFANEIIDEAQYIKNHNTQASQSVRLVESDFRLALTGTPIENHLSELWSIMDYLMPGFLLCFAGDLFMGLHNRHVKKQYLLLGTLLFLLGHICFISYLYTLSGFTPYDLILPTLGVIGVLVLKKIPSFFLGKFAYAGMIYAIFVCTMAGKSIQVLWTHPGAKGICLALGGIFFLTSDVLIAPLYFKKKRAWAVHGLNIGTYYLAMFFIAVSVLF